MNQLNQIKKFFKRAWSNQNIRRWTIEGLASIAVGVLAACLTFHTLNKGKSSLEVSEAGAAAPIVEAGDNAGVEVNGEGLPADDPDADVVIEVVEGNDISSGSNYSSSDYAPEISNWSSEEIEAAVSERSGYQEKSKYNSALADYWENVRGVRDISNQCMYMFDTNKVVYTAADFEGLSSEVIHIAKNEIYARRGYSFRDPDLYNYFMGEIWYTPSVLPADFSENIFTETEVKNLDLLNELDTYQ
jgi:hypothetical protein